jgi:hypothetical protein
MRSIEDHKKFLIDMIHIQLDYIYFKKREFPEWDMKFLVERHCMLPNFTDFNTGMLFDMPKIERVHEWNALVYRLDCIFSLSNNRDYFTEKALELLVPTVDGRMEMDMGMFEHMHENEEAIARGALVYSTDNKEVCNFHVVNANYPKCFLDPDFGFKEEVDAMIADLKAHGVKKLVGSSWLNGIPKWLHKFPKGYEENTEEYPDTEDCHLGVWGQFMTYDFKINYRTWKKMITKKDLPYFLKVSTLYL